MEHRLNGGVLTRRTGGLPGIASSGPGSGPHEGRVRHRPPGESTENDRDCAACSIELRDAWDLELRYHFDHIAR